MAQDSFVMYRSFLSGLKDLPDADRLKLIDAIADYCLDDKEPELTGIHSTLWQFMRPQFDANKKKRAQGAKGGSFGHLGGRPKTPRKPQENPTVTPSKPHQNPIKTPNVNDNVNGNVNEHSHYQEPRPLTINLEPNTGTPRRKNILYYSFSSVTADQFFESLSANTPTSKLCEEQAKELGIKFRTRKYLVPHIKEVFKNWMVSGRLEWLTPERFAEVTPKNMPQFMHLPGLTVDEPNNPTA